MKCAAGLFVALLFGVAATEPGDNDGLAFTHVTVIDGSGRPAADQTVLVAGGRVVELGPAPQIKVPPGARTIDGSAKFLIPGLWDMHVHIAGINADPNWSKEALLPLLTAYGITGVRDMGGDLSALSRWRSEIAGGELFGPEIVAAGPMLIGEGQKNAEQYPVSTEAEARAAVRELKEQGADFIKIISVRSREIFFSIADEARKQGLPFAGHVPFSVSAAEASDAGMKSIEHIVYSNLAFDCSTREEELRRAVRSGREKGDRSAYAKAMLEAIASYSPEKAAALWGRFKRNGTWVVPTLESIYQQAPQHTTPEARASDLKLTRGMHRAGVPILAGSDSLDRFVFPGSSLHRELALLVEAGFTPAQALESATGSPARFLGREKQTGTIARGTRADFVLLDANPLQNVANTTKIRGVVRAGVYLDRAALDALLVRAKAAAAKGTVTN